MTMGVSWLSPELSVEGASSFICRCSLNLALLPVCLWGVRPTRSACQGLASGATWRDGLALVSRLAAPCEAVMGHGDPLYGGLWMGLSLGCRGSHLGAPGHAATGLAELGWPASRSSFPVMLIKPSCLLPQHTTSVFIEACSW